MYQNTTIIFMCELYLLFLGTKKQVLLLNLIFNAIF